MDLEQTEIRQSPLKDFAKFRNFILQLLQKLKHGTTRMPHFNALPGRSLQRISSLALEELIKDFQTQFIKTLYEKQTWRVELNVSEEQIKKTLINIGSLTQKQKQAAQLDNQAKALFIRKRLGTITNTLKSEFEEFGTKSFSYGYPLLVINDPQKNERILKIPLFFWNIGIERSSRKADTWILTRSDDDAIQINELFVNYMETYKKVNLSNFRDEFEKTVDDGLITQKELNDAIARLLEALSLKKLTTISIPKDADKEYFESQFAENGPFIAKFGVFGFFKTFKASIVNDFNQFIANIDTHWKDLEEKLFTRGNQLTGVEQDPTQTKVLSNLDSETNIIIQGPPGTGKSQTLTALLTNAMGNGARCLVVCEKRTALEVIKANLESLGLGQYLALIEDPIRDRNVTVDLVRETEANAGPIFYGDDTDSFNLIKDRIKELEVKLLAHHQTLGKKLLVGKNWTHLVGKWLHLKKLNLPDFPINPANELTEQYFLNSNKVIGEASIIRSHIRYNELLDSINKELIVKCNVVTAKENVINEVDQTIEIVTKLKSCVIKLLDQNYTKELNYYDREVKRLKNFVLDTINSISSAEYSKYQQTSLKSVRFKALGLLAFFSKKLKKINSNINSVVHNFDLIVSDVKSIFNATVPLEKGSKLSDVLQELTKVEINLQSIELSLPTNIQNRIAKSTFKKINENFVESKDLEKCIKLVAQIEHIQNLIQIPIKISLKSTLVSIPEYIDKIVRDYEKLKENLVDFKDFHEWNTFYYSLGESKNLIKTLLPYDCSMWKDIFEFHFLSRLLKNVWSEEILSDERFIVELEQYTNLAKSSLLKRINSIWDRERYYSTLAFNRRTGMQLTSLYNKKGAPGKHRNSLRSILKFDLKLFTSYFPVILTNPTTVASIIPFIPRYFDYVIFDEASQLRVEDTYLSLLRGKHVVVSGDIHQMPPTNHFGANLTETEVDGDDEIADNQAQIVNALENKHTQELTEMESLLEFAVEQGFKKTYLGIHYRSRHPKLIDFSNAAFYGKKLLPVPPLYEGMQPIIYKQVNGIYDSKTNTNEDEARAVLNYLSNLNEQENSYPSIGIATFNMHQRDLITELIDQKRVEDEAFNKKIELLNEKGLFIKNLENIQGDERDIIIISTTFGRNEEGHFRQNFGPISNRNGYKLLNVIVTRAKNQLFVYTSIPESNINTYSTELTAKGENDGKGIFYAYLAYARAVSNNDEEQRSQIIDTLLKQSKEQSIKLNSDELLGVESPFEEEVVDELIKFVDSSRIRLQYKYGGFRIDITIKPTNPNGKILAIECDGASYHDSQEAHVWDVFRQKYLESRNFKFHRIWSTNWWADYKNEIEKLKSFVNSNGG